jgi:drug/metabolite transporter (DMT)-like permease
MQQTDRTRETQAEILLLSVVVIWASNFPIAKYAISRLDVFVFNSIRFVVAAIVLAILFRFTSRWTPIERTDWRRLLQAGLVANVLYQVAFIVGLRMTTAGNSAVLLNTAPLWTLFFNARIHKERILPHMWTGMAFSLLGVVLIIVGSGKKLELGGNDLFGDLISLTAAVLWAFNTNLQKPLLVRYSALQLAFVMISVGATGLSMIAIPSLASLQWHSVRWTYYAAAVASGLLSIAAGNFFWSFGVKRLGPGKTSNFGNLVPVLALVIAYFALDEELSLIQMSGAAITLGGVWLARR